MKKPKPELALESQMLGTYCTKLHEPVPAHASWMAANGRQEL